MPVKLAAGTSQFSEAHWGPALNKYASSVNSISNDKWQKFLVAVQLMQLLCMTGHYLPLMLQELDTHTAYIPTYGLLSK
jgi:hypothetical protein